MYFILTVNPGKYNNWLVSGRCSVLRVMTASFLIDRFFVYVFALWTAHALNLGGKTFPGGHYVFIILQQKSNQKRHKLSSRFTKTVILITLLKAKLKMPSSCCAVGCSNRKSSEKELLFYRIPSEKDPERRQSWIDAVGRKDWSQEKINNARLCSEHFISGKSICYIINSKPFQKSFFTISLQYLATTKCPYTNINSYQNHACHGWMDLSLSCFWFDVMICVL